MYRIGVDIGQRAKVERDLSSDLGSYPEVWCAWSDPGDNHAVIISYTGVIRQDVTVDPEEPSWMSPVESRTAGWILQELERGVGSVHGARAGSRVTPDGNCYERSPAGRI